jgi:hypothetical protein
MIKECNEVKTVSEIIGNKIKISCTILKDTPKIFKVDLLKTSETINNEPGIEGELLLTHVDSNESVGKINDNGDLLLNLEDDDANRYYIDDDGNLKYKEDE